MFFLIFPRFRIPKGSSMYPNREERKVGRDPTIMKLENSCTTYEENSQGRVDTECPPILLTQMMDPSQGREKESQIRRNGFTNPNCHSTLLRPMPRITKLMRTIRKQERSLESSSVISPLLRETYVDPPQLHRVSQSQSGDTSFVEKPSILTSSLAISTTLPLLRRMLATSEEQRSLLEAQILRERSKWVATGPLHGTRPSRQPHMPFHTKLMSYNNGVTTCYLNSQPDKPMPIRSSLLLTKLLGHESVEDRQSYLPTAMNSPIFTQPSFSLMASRQVQLDNKGTELDLLPQISVDTSIAWVDAEAQQEHAVITTPVSNANHQDTGKKVALRKHEVTYGMHPKYLRYNVWHAQDFRGMDNQEDSLQCLADWTEHAKPLPSVPLSKLQNTVALDTINNHSNLFKIVTPINVDHFKALLNSHPNQPFVKSVCRGLQEGFWPWADTHLGKYPTTVDESLGMPDSRPEADFLHVQRDQERLAGRFSGSFGWDLLPSMHASLVHAIPKPHSDKLQMVIDQSAGFFSPNSMIKWEDIRGFPLDKIMHLGEGLICWHHVKPGQSLVVYKSDVADAYHLLSMHPLWQVKQIVTIDGKQDVDWNNCFGGQG